MDLDSLTVAPAPDWFINAFSPVDERDEADEEPDGDDRYPLGFV